MSCSCSTNTVFQTGADPQNIQWTIVRGDDASIRFEFYEDDGVTYKDITSWTVLASVYDPKTATKYGLTVTKGTGYIDISSPSTQTALWGTGSSSIVAELAFDLQITISSLKWTPIVGTIVVRSDITGSSL
jgi:hypothetical protein